MGEKKLISQRNLRSETEDRAYIHLERYFINSLGTREDVEQRYWRIL